MRMTTIEIDWDIHQRIENERRGFEEAPWQALRRLLGLHDIDAKKKTDAPLPLSAGLAWFEDGVEVPHGSSARMRYNHGRQVYEGSFLNGRLVVNGKAYDTLSAAASDLAVTKGGKKTQINGWRYWEVLFPGDSIWLRLDDLRRPNFREMLDNLDISL